MTPPHAPIALFAYRRLAHLTTTVLALRDNRLACDSPLHVFCDGLRDAEDAPQVAEVRDFVRQIGGFKSVSIIEAEPHQGLARAITTGVTRMLENVGARPLYDPRMSPPAVAPVEPARLPADMGYDRAQQRLARAQPAAVVAEMAGMDQLECVPQVSNERRRQRMTVNARAAEGGTMAATCSKRAIGRVAVA